MLRRWTLARPGDATDDDGGSPALPIRAAVTSAGHITLNIDTLMAGNSTISGSSSLDDSVVGNAGGITIQGTNPGTPATHVSLDNSRTSTTIAGGALSTTPATIEITTQTVNLTNGAQIKADTSGAVPAGGITLKVDRLTAAGDSEISSAASLMSRCRIEREGMRGTLRFR